MAGTIYTRLFRKLKPLVDKLGSDSYLKVEVQGFMSLHLDKLAWDQTTECMRISLAHNYIQNGDVCAYPDMEISVNLKHEVAEALTYQDIYRYQEVYFEQDGRKMVRPKLKGQLNHFLETWLDTLKRQGFFDALEAQGKT